MRSNLDTGQGGRQSVETNGIMLIFSYLADPNPHLGNFRLILRFFPWSSELGRAVIRLWE